MPSLIPPILFAAQAASPQGASLPARIKPEVVTPEPFWKKAFLHVFPESGLMDAQKQFDTFKNTLVERNGLKKNPTFYISKPVYYQAAAGPKQLITVTLGALKNARRPDEVAFALAHEISHIQHGDIRNRVLFLLASFLLTTTGVILSSKLLKKAIEKHYQNKKPQQKDQRNRKFFNIARWMAAFAVGAVLARVNGLIGRAISRQVEARCDIDAIRYLQKAGFSAKGYKDFMLHGPEVWHRGRPQAMIIREEAQAKRLGHSHPVKDTRIAAMERYLAAHPDAADAKAFMSDTEWARLRRLITPAFEASERELAANLLSAHNIDPKTMGIIV